MTRKRIALGVFRVIATAYALLIGTQPVWIGMFLQGDFDKLAVHRGVGGASIAATWLLTAAAVLLWRPGRVAWWPMVACLGLGAVVITQFVLGATRFIGLHIPLGVTIVALAVSLAIWSWLPSTGRVARGSSPAPAEQPRREEIAA